MRFLFIILLFISYKAIGQTRMYFPLSEAAAVTPSYAAAWEYTSEAVSRKLANVKGSSAITIGTQVGAWTSTGIRSAKALDRQYVSTRMDAGIAFTSGVTTMGGQLMVREYNNGDNVDAFYVIARIVSEDGSTVRATLFSNVVGTGTEFINNATHRNQTWGGGTIIASYTTVLGDRLCIEMGYTDNVGSTPEASSKWGENATDLPANSTQTTDGAGWIEFSNTITFAGEAGPTRRVIIIQ